MRNSKKIISTLLVSIILISSTSLGVADIDQINVYIEEEKETLFKHKEEMKKTLEQIKESKKALIKVKKSIKQQYSQKEIDDIKKASQKIESIDKDIKALSFDDVIVKDKNIKFDTPPVVKKGRTLIPIRAITEGFGANVEWDEISEQVTINKDGNRVILTIGSNKAVVNDKEVELEVSANVYSNRTYVPLRFIGENLGIDVDWDDDLKIIKVNEKEKSAKSFSFNIM